MQFFIKNKIRNFENTRESSPYKMVNIQNSL